MMPLTMLTLTITLYMISLCRRSRDMGIAEYCESINIPFSVELVGITTTGCTLK